jgi:hypothetical protein
MPMTTIRIMIQVLQTVKITNISGKSAAFKLHGQMTTHKTAHLINYKTTIYKFVQPSQPTYPRQP